MATQNNEESLVLTCKEARRMLGNPSKSVFYDALHRGIIPCIRLGPKKIIIPRTRFLRWLNEDGKLHTEG